MCYDHEGGGSEIRSLRQSCRCFVVRQSNERLVHSCGCRLVDWRLRQHRGSSSSTKRARSRQSLKVRETVPSSAGLNWHIAAHMIKGSGRFGIVVSLQGYSIPVRANVVTSDLIRSFVGSERRGACERRSSSGRLRRSQNWNYRRLRTSSARRTQVMELSYAVEEASPPSRGWSTDAPPMYPELQ